MDKEKLQQKMEDAEQRCRLLYDELMTLKNRLEEVQIELERSRGDFRTLQALVGDLSKEPAQIPPTADSFPSGEQTNPPDPAPVPTAVDHKVKKEK